MWMLNILIFLVVVGLLLWVFGIFKVNVRPADKPGTEGQQLTVFGWSPPDEKKIKQWHRGVCLSVGLFIGAYASMNIAQDYAVGTVGFGFWITVMGMFFVGFALASIFTLVNYFDNTRRY